MGPLDKAIDEETTQQRIDQLRQSLHRLGTVHLGVLEEHKEQQERYDFLRQQRDDLVIAAEDLKKTLSLIDRTARRMFLKSFEQIRETFKETFVRFFPGGEADLRLEENIDALEAHIDIIARPRGKRLQNIALLSGGERALTAISLLFAIYQVKPSPFCILDEVDAPLDDANINRFVRVLEEFARETQFVVVTHNKITMAAADALHGVTMPEEGVSQLVSVRVEGEELEGRSRLAGAEAHNQKGDLSRGPLFSCHERGHFSSLIRNRAWSSMPARARLSVPPDSRSITQMACETSAPRLRRS